jgi:peptidyl-prolyl cis-trans isomerase A (cyclophilin A)
MRAMKRMTCVLAIAVAATACEKSKGPSEEAPVEKGSKVKPLPPPAPKPIDAGVDAALAAADAAEGGAGASVPAVTPPPVGGATDTVRAPAATDLAEYLKGVRGTGALRADIATSLGTFHCQLFEKEAPMTVANFVGLATGKKPWVHPKTQATMKNTPFFNGLIFHRVIPGFMIQGGDPLGEGIGGPGYQFEDEIAPQLAMDKPGLLAMANSGPATNGSQFFITEAAATWLTGKHTIFGSCAEVELVKKITGVPRGPNDRPTTPVTITKVTILRR